MKKLLSICFILLFLQLASADSVGASINVPDLNDSNLTTSYQPGTYYQGSTVKIIADYEDNASADLLGANVTVTISGVPHQMTYSASDSAYVYSHLFLTSGVYFMSVKAEVSGYDVQIKTVSVTILSSGGGGGGGSWYPPVTNDTINVTVNNFTGEFPAVEENESIIVNIDIYGNDFQTLLIIAADRITSGDIIITTEECANIQISSERVPYDCISVNLESIEPEKYKEVYLYFRVSKRWTEANGINPFSIGLMKFDEGNHSDLSLTKIIEDNDYYYYYANFKSFSDFIIYGEKGGVILPYCGDGLCDNNENCSTCAADCGECEPIIPPVLVDECELLGFSYGRFLVCWYWWTAVLTLIILYELVRILLKKPPFFRPRAVSAVKASKKRKRWSASYELEKKKWMDNYEKEKEIKLRGKKR